MIRRPPRSTLDRSSAASDVYKRQDNFLSVAAFGGDAGPGVGFDIYTTSKMGFGSVYGLSLIHISEPTRPY